jgi:hypothetical protein
LVGSIDDRMPVILHPGDFGLWLDPAVQDAKRLEPLLVPYTGEGMEAYPVSTLVNNPKADDPRCIELAAQGQSSRDAARINLHGQMRWSSQTGVAEFGARRRK